VRVPTLFTRPVPSDSTEFIHLPATVVPASRGGDSPQGALLAGHLEGNAGAHNACRIQLMRLDLGNLLEDAGRQVAHATNGWLLRR
jgi:hypothetical protein